VKQCERQRIKGWFYLPEDPEHRVPGILTWEPTDGATLELIGGFSPEPTYTETEGGGRRTTQIVGDIGPGTIYGVSDSGQPLSLWEAQRGNYRAGFTGTVQDEYWHSSLLCVGAHIASPQEPLITRLSIALDDLYYLTDDGRLCAPQWARIEGVEHPGETQPDGTLLTPYIFPVIGGYRANYAQGATPQAHYSVGTFATRPWLSDATEAMPDLKLQMMTSNKRRGRIVELRVDAHVSVQQPDHAPGPAATFIDNLAPITDLMRLATFGPSGVEEIFVHTGENEESTHLLTQMGNVARPDDTHDQSSVVFTLADVPLDAYLQTWGQLTDGNQANYAWNVVVGLCGYSPQYVEEYASQALAAAEGFHTWCLAGGDMSLKERLRNLYERLSPPVQAKLNIDVDKWLSWAVWARNHVAHGGVRRWRALENGSQLYVIAQSVNLVTYLVALQQFSVPEGKVLDALLNHPRLQVMAQQCHELDRLPDDQG
jgi:ApeA N-terminal domain 1